MNSLKGAVGNGVIAAVAAAVGLWSQPCLTASLVSGRFDHEVHNEKVFKPQGLECSKCHNFNVDRLTRKAVPGEKFNEGGLRIALKDACHMCHRSGESKHQSAPKACITCHRSMETLRAIKPENHANIAWRSAHATEARVSGDSCLNCHMTSQCAKCHLQRNDVEMRNHTRNFKFTHSVQARLQPQRCDSCHTKSYCTSCHMGKK